MYFWKLFDRWGPAALSAVTLIACIGFLWLQGERCARIEGSVSEVRRQIDSRNLMENSLRTEVQTEEAYVASLEKTLIRAHIELPPRQAAANMVQQMTSYIILLERRLGASHVPIPTRPPSLREN